MSSDTRAGKSVIEALSDVMRDEAELARFWAKVEKTETCWLWVGARSANGYGAGRANKRQVGAHRISYQLAYDAVPAGLVIDHLCRVRHCVNPAHLEAVPQRVNLERGENHVAHNMIATSCCNGHEFTPENTYQRSDGARNCRTCIRENMRRFRARRRAA